MGDPASSHEPSRTMCLVYGKGQAFGFGNFVDKTLTAENAEERKEGRKKAKR